MIIKLLPFHFLRIARVPHEPQENRIPPKREKNGREERGKRRKPRGRRKRGRRRRDRGKPRKRLRGNGKRERRERTGRGGINMLTS